MKKHKDSLWYRGLKQAERSWDEHNGNLNILEEDLLDYKMINGEDDFYKGIKDYLEFRLEKQRKRSLRLEISRLDYLKSIRKELYHETVLPERLY